MRDDLAEVQIADDHKNRNDRHTHRNFVGNHLRAGSNAAEKRKFGIRRVTGEHDSINAERHDTERVRMPMFKSAMTICWLPSVEPNGITATVRNAGIKVMAGASQK